MMWIVLIVIFTYLITGCVKSIRQYNRRKILYHTEDEDNVNKITNAIQDAINHINKENKKE